MYLFLKTTTSRVIGLTISAAAYRPRKRSNNDSINFPSRSSYNAMVRTPLSVPQSSSVITTSWLTSTRRRVKYPDSAVFNAVSVEPFRAPWVEIKNSDIVKPSRKEALIGNSMVFPEGFAIKPRIPANWVKLEMFPRAPESDIIRMWLSNFSSSLSPSWISSFAFFHSSTTKLIRSVSVSNPS